MKRITSLLLYLLKCLLILYVFSNQIAFGQSIPISKGNIDIVFVYNDPSSYITIDKQKCFQFNVKQFDNSRLKINTGLKNLSSAALSFKFWTIMDEPIMNPAFVYSLNKEGLAGKEHYVKFIEISKYPDLVKRYLAISPTSVNAIVCMGLNTNNKFDFGYFGFFKIEDNDLVIAANEKKPISSPVSKSWGQMVKFYNTDGVGYSFPEFRDYKTTEEDKKKLADHISRTTKVEPKAWVKVSNGTVRSVGIQNNNNIFIQITWPDEEIDKIYKDFRKYESGNEKTPLEQVADALKKENVKQYTKNDSWAKAYEDEVGNVEAFADEKNYGLKNKYREIATFNKKEWNGLRAINNSPYFVLTKYNGEDNRGYSRSILVLLNKRGQKIQIAGKEQFDRIDFNENVGKLEFYETLEDYVNVGSKTSASFDFPEKLYSSPNEARELILDYINSYNSKPGKKGEYSIVMMYQYSYKKIRRIKTDLKLNVLEDISGYIIR